MRSDKQQFNDKSRLLNRGFTLLEIVIVIALTAMLLVMVFQALGKVKENESRAQQNKNIEKEAFLLFHRLSPLFKNISSQRVFNGLEMSECFQGSSKGMTFLTRSPLVAPFHSLYLTELLFRDHILYYREKELLTNAPGKPVSFQELSTQPFLPLLKEVEQASFQFFSWDQSSRRYLWKNAVDTFKKDRTPDEVLLHMIYHGKKYRFQFPKVITDLQQEVPGDLFK